MIINSKSNENQIKKYKAFDNTIAEVVIGKKGFNTLKISREGKEKLIHSTYDPVSESKKMTDDFEFENKDLIIVFGAGLGYHLDFILEKGVEGKHIVILEPSAAIAAIFFKEYYEKNNFKDQLSLIIWKDSKELTESISFFIDRTKIIAGVQVFILNSYIDLFTNEYTNVVRIINQLKGRLEVEINSIIWSGQYWTDNMFFNRGLIKNKVCPVNTLFGQFKKVPVIIVTAGPSLNKNISYLKQVSDSVFIICTDSAYRALFNNNIKPHLIISISGHVDNYHKLKGLDYNDIPFVYKPASYYKILSSDIKQKFMAAETDLILFDVLNDAQKEIGVLRSGGSVACSALDLAIKMDFSPIILVGQDLAYTNGESHVKGSVGYSTNDSSDREFISSEDIFGNKILTTHNFIAIKKWIENRIIQDNNKHEYLNATEGGLNIDGTKNITLKDVYDRFRIKSDYSDKLIKIFNNSGGLKSDMLKNLNKAYDLADKRIWEISVKLEERLNENKLEYSEELFKEIIGGCKPIYYSLYAKAYELGKFHGGFTKKFYNEFFNSAKDIINKYLDLLR